MRIRYTVPVVHKGTAPGGVQYELGGWSYSFAVDAGRLVSLSIEVPNYPVCALPKVVVDPASRELLSIALQIDPIWPEVERALMIVEGVMSMYGLERFVLEEVQSEWLPDSEDERERLAIYSFKASVGKSKDAPPVLYDMFIRSFLIAPLVANREVTLNFMRRGRDDLYERRYVDAVYDFFLALETSFAGGAFKKQEVVRRMLANNLLVDSLAIVRTRLSHDVEFIKLTSDSSKFNYLSATAAQILEHLVAVRGLLHHHTSAGGKTWHPSRQDEFRMDAVFLAELCLDIFNGEVTKSMFSDGIADAFAKVKIRSEDGRPINFVPIED